MPSWAFCPCWLSQAWIFPSALTRRHTHSHRTLRQPVRDSLAGYQTGDTEVKMLLPKCHRQRSLLTAFSNTGTEVFFLNKDTGKTWVLEITLDSDILVILNIGLCPKTNPVCSEWMTVKSHIWLNANTNDVNILFRHVSYTSSTSNFFAFNFPIQIWLNMKADYNHNLTWFHQNDYNIHGRLYMTVSNEGACARLFTVQRQERISWVSSFTSRWLIL